MNSPPASDSLLPDESDDSIDEPDCYETIMAALHDEDEGAVSKDGLTPTIDTGEEILDQTLQVSGDGTVPHTTPGRVHSTNKVTSGSALPDRVGKFAIKRELGRGAFGVVYLGYDEELQRNVAIKVSLVSDPTRQEKLKTEASKAAQIESSGIVPVYHIGTTDQGLVFIVHKFIPGCSLRDVLKQGPISPSRATALMRDLAIAMAPAHQLDILHRDLKPDNVLIDEKGNAWIADFGLAISENEQTSQRRELAGTPPYMSPEQIKGRIDFLDPRSDLWAFGVMYYELLSGKLPFRGKCRASLTEQICERDPRPLQQYAPKILTDEINQVFAKACAKQPSDRYSTMVEFAEALDDLLDVGLSDQNILGESTEDRFGDDDSDFMPIRSRSSSQLSRGSLSRKSYRSNDAKFSSSELSVGGHRQSLSMMLLGGLLVACSIGAALFYAKGFAEPEPALTAAANIESVIPELKPSKPAEEAVIGDGDEVDEPPLDPTEIVDPIPTAPETTVPEPSAPEPKPLPSGSKNDPMVVVADSTGSHLTLAAAIADAPPDGFIQLKPGIYKESLLIDKPITITGPPHAAGDDFKCILRNDTDTLIRVDSEQGTVSLRGISIVGKGTKMTNEFNAVEVVAGTLIIQDVDLTTSSFNCVKVRTNAIFGAQNCRFFDSRKIAVSAKNHAEVQLVDCQFQGSGVELIGGGGKVAGCEFFGARGVWCQDNASAVRISGCKFDNGTSDSVAALQGAKVVLKDSEFLRGNKAIQVIGGDVVVQAGCLINDYTVAAFVSSGSLQIESAEILESGSSAFQVAGSAKVSIKNCKIEGASAFGIDMVSGSLEVTGGSIAGCRTGCINLDAAEDDADEDKPVNPLQASLADCTLSSPNVGIAIRSGDVSLDNVKFDSGGKQDAGIGMFVDGSKIDQETNPVIVRMGDAMTFSDALKISVFAKGNAILDVPEKMQISLRDTAKLLPPARYKDPANTTETESE
ncbi:protein kinase domain-containing protein [Rubripirellula obstinata]|nr:protein kinase [Rubripirellula obstinata]